MVVSRETGPDSLLNKPGTPEMTRRQFLKLVLAAGPVGMSDCGGGDELLAPQITLGAGDNISDIYEGVQPVSEAPFAPGMRRFFTEHEADAPCPPRVNSAEWSWRDLLSLTKPRVAVLLLLTALVAMFLVKEGNPSPVRVFLTMLGGYLAAGGASAINCYLDRDIDGQMERTCHRALPSGRLKPLHSLGLGLLLGLLSGLILWYGTEPLAAVLALLAMAHYVLVYTLWLKRRSSHNVVIGGLAGAVPPLVGGAAVTGTLSPVALILAAIVFCWTPPHFWAIALMRREEYARISIPMLPVVRGVRVTHQQILAYVGATVVLSALPLVTGSLGIFYTAGAAILSGLFLYFALRMRRGKAPRATREFYFFSLIYLAALFLTMLIDHLIIP